MSKISLSNRHIAEVLSPEQRKKAQEILNKETGADKSQEEAKARKERSEIRKEKELELKQANLEIRKKREARRDEGREERKADKVAREKADALKDKQKGLAADIKQKRTEAGAAKQKAVAATKKNYDTITDKDGDGTALGKMGSNIAKAGGAVAGSVANRIKAFRKNRQADKTQKELDKTKTEQFLYEVETVEKKEKIDKIIDIMKGKNKIEVNPTVKAEGVIDAVKAGAKRHSKAIEKKKIKNRKAVPYAALAAEHQPEGEELKEYSPNVTYQAKGGKKSGKLGKSSVYSLRDKDESKKEFRKSQVKDIRGGYLKTEDYYSGTGEKVQKRTLAWMKKKGQKGAPGLDAMKARTAEHKAKRGVKEEVGCETKKIENKGKKKIDPKKNPVVEAKVDKGRSDYGKATIRNWRHSGPDTVEPAMFDPENKRGKTIDKRRAEHKARRGVKGAKVPAYKVDENVTIQDANGNDFLEVVDLIKPEPIKSPKNNIKFEEAKKPEGGDSRPTVNKKKIDIVMNAVERERKRKNALQIQGIIGT